MTHIILPRGIQLDVLFRLRIRQGGPLADDDQWTDGTTAPQWPEVAFRSESTNVDHTADIVKDIASDIVTPWQKHPVTTTGIIRDNAVGQYRVRTKPLITLPVGNYILKITADIGGAPFIEEHTVAVVLPGDIEFGNEGIYCSEEDVLANFELEGVVTSAQITKARASADNLVNAYLQAEQIDTPFAEHERYVAIKLAAVAFARAELRRLTQGTVGPGMGIRRIRELDTEYEFVSGDTLFKNLHAEGASWMEKAIMAILGNVYLKTSKMNVPDYG